MVWALHANPSARCRGRVLQRPDEAVDVGVGDVQVRGDPQGAAAECGVAVGRGEGREDGVAEVVGDGQAEQVRAALRGRVRGEPERGSCARRSSR